jgi:cobalamin biosynthesis Mg chelatase CobN
MSEKNGSAPKPSINELRADIRQTREELGETVQALAAKADVKARAKEQVEQTKLKVRAQAVEATERVRDAAVAAAGVVSGKVREATDQASTAAGVVGGKVRDATDQAGTAADQAASSDLVVDVRAKMRNSPVPLSLVFAGVAAVVGVILIVRGRRR